MQLGHNTLVVVADGRKAPFLRNAGDADHPNHVEIENRLAGEIAKDLAGHPPPDIGKALTAA